MAKASVFRDFMAVLRKKWRAELPFIRPIDKPLEALPKASTFIAGVAQPSRLLVFLNFQHSNKAWEVGQFTINVVLARTEQSARGWGMDEVPAAGRPFGEGTYRIGWIVGTADKWWHLKKDRPSGFTLAWRPTSYDDRDTVLREAAEDVTRDVLTVLRRVGVPEAASQVERVAE